MGCSANTYACGLWFQLIPQISSLTPLTTILPLIAVLLVTAGKDAIDDIVSTSSQLNNARLLHLFLLLLFWFCMHLILLSFCHLPHYLASD